MEKELVVDSQGGVIKLALIENSKLVEIQSEQGSDDLAIGDIVLGRVKKLMPWMNAAFVDIGHERDAFIHYTDLGPNLNSVLKFTKDAKAGLFQNGTLDNFKIVPEIDKEGKIAQVLTKKLEILVQIQKEPISTKGHRLTCEMSIPGRYLVLVPFTNIIAISKKIESSEERSRLSTLIESIKPKNFGVIVRTAAQNVKVAELHQDIEMLVNKWKSLTQELNGANAPKRMLRELDKTSSIIRDLLSEDFNNITVNDKDTYESIKSYIETFAPEKAKIVNHYKSTTKSIFDAFGITKQIKSSFGKTSSLSSGTYIIIEHTEAMHVIDVNSGHKKNSENQEDSSLAVNLEAAAEIARQLRLRDIGGIIIIDFIDMKSPENRKTLQTAMLEYMSSDRAQHTILPLSKFGLMQITRQRVKPQVMINTMETCPTCNGTGKIDASILITEEIANKLEELLESKQYASISLTAHPYITTYLKKDFYKLQRQWFWKYKKIVKIYMNENYTLNEYDLNDQNGNEIGE